MKYPLPKSLGAALILAGMAFPSAAFCETLSAGAELTATATPDGRAVTLMAPIGSYVAGDFLPSGGELTLDLRSDGQTVRQLSRSSGGKQEFQFVAPENAELRARGPQDGAFSLRLRTVVAPQDLHPAKAEYLSPTIAALAESGPDTQAFWAQRQQDGTPMIEADGDAYIVTFLFRGAQRNVRLFGGPGSDHDFLQNLTGTDVWFRSYRVPSSTRLAYRLAPDIPDIPGNAQIRRRAILTTAAADPLNPHVWPADAPDAFNQWSVLELPDAPVQPGYPPLPATVTEDRFTSSILGNTRRIQFYSSPGFDPADPKALLLFVFDGPRAVAEMEVPGALERLTTEGRLPPIAAVFVDPIDGTTRGAELPGNPDFARFMAEELLPYAAAKLHMTPQAARTIVAGASYGGIGSANVALSYPDLFGAAISMSGSYWWAPEGAPETPLSWMAERVLVAPTLPRMVITAGEFEIARPQNGVQPADIRETSRQLYGIMKARGGEAHWREYAGGHDSIVWRGALTDGLLALFPPV